MCDGQHRPTVSATWENLKQPMPLGRKLRLVAKNLWIRVRTGSACCGNYGEPGC
ncbi:MAG: hypothetical protein HPY83_07270 [Anaerolineae bacterium]|nr:hypothetical protein [Anaerolineae bacterium]